MIDQDILPMNIASHCIITDDTLTIDSSKSEFFFYSMLKDKVFQVYKTKLKQSVILNESNQRRQNLISSPVEYVSNGELSAGIIETIREFSRWFSDYLLSLPGFKSVNSDDFKEIIINGSLANINAHVSKYYDKNECRFITKNGYQMTRMRLNQVCVIFFLKLYPLYLSDHLLCFQKVYGPFKGTLIFLARYKLEKLDLTEYECSLLFIYMALAQCEGNF